MDLFNKIAQTALVLSIATIWVHIAVQIIKFGKEFGVHLFEWTPLTILTLAFAGLSFFFWIIAIIYNIWK
jgi:hypothetical protein